MADEKEAVAMVAVGQMVASTKTIWHVVKDGKPGTAICGRWVEADTVEDRNILDRKGTPCCRACMHRWWTKVLGMTS